MPYFTHRGIRFHYREQGSGPALLVLPGNTASSACHESELEFFAGLGYRALSLDFAGTGLSTRVPRPWPLDWFQRNASDCAALLDQAGEPGCIACGTSGGAIVALWMAIRYPQRVRAVIADSEGCFYPAGAFDHLLEERGQHTEGQVGFWSKAHGADWLSVVDADTELLQNLDLANREAGGWDVFEGRLGEIRCPVLFSCSLADSLIAHIGKQTVEMSAQVRDSWCFCVNGGDHPLMWSRPEAFRPVTHAFLDQLQAR